MGSPRFLQTPVTGGTFGDNHVSNEGCNEHSVFREVGSGLTARLANGSGVRTANDQTPVVISDDEATESERTALAQL